MPYYVQPHVTQFDGDAHQGSACVPASCANGVAASTGGARKPTSAGIHHLIPQGQETDPRTPGWSMPDADHAMAKMGIPFTKLEGWDEIKKAHESGHYVIVQGDSDRFSNNTCSGKFDGNHCIGGHPRETTINGHVAWWIDDPICKTGRWELESTIRTYAGDIPGRPVWGGYFNNKVPQTGVPPKPATVVLRYGGQKLTPRQVKRIKVPAGRRANIRKRPDRINPADVIGHLANGRTFTAYQRTRTGASLAGSRTWFGDATGTRWLHVSSF